MGENMQIMRLSVCVCVCVCVCDYVSKSRVALIYAEL